MLARKCREKDHYRIRCSFKIIVVIDEDPPSMETLVSLSIRILNLIMGSILVMATILSSATRQPTLLVVGIYTRTPRIKVLTVASNRK